MPSRTALTVSQNVLTTISSDAQTFMNSLISAQNTGDVSTLATQAQSLLDSFTGDSNTASAGAYVFGGTNNSVAPIANYSGAPQTATAAAFQTAFGFPQSSSQASSITATQMQRFCREASPIFLPIPPGATKLVPSVWQRDIRLHFAGAERNHLRQC